MTEEDFIIGQIIDSFQTFAFGDIEYNVKPKPIAAFILCSCLIDQLAAFRYNKIDDSAESYNEFIKDYLPQYRALNLYVNLRCRLVHNYTVGKHIKITNDEVIFENIGKGKNVNVLTSQMLFNDLKGAFELFCTHLKETTSDARKNAIERWKDSYIITKNVYKTTTYLDYEADFLIKHYKRILQGEFIHENQKLRINSISKSEMIPGSWLVMVYATYANHPYNCHLGEMITRLNLETASDVLKRLHQNP
ncbi:MAG: hypothetical protein QM726_12420 [Chitinophagaceae bacterium]